MTEREKKINEIKNQQIELAAKLETLINETEVIPEVAETEIESIVNNIYK